MKDCFKNIAGNFDKPYFSENIHYNLEIIYPTNPPLPGQKIVGYWVYPPSNKCFVPPCQRSMNILGMLSSVLLAIFFWPACFFPICMGCSYDGFQVPIYEF